MDSGQGHLDREKDILGTKVLIKSCPYYGDRCPKQCLVNIQTPVRMTTCPPRLQLQTLWKEAILTGKMTFIRDSITRLSGLNHTTNSNKRESETAGQDNRVD